LFIHRFMGDLTFVDEISKCQRSFQKIHVDISISQIRWLFELVLTWKLLIWISHYQSNHIPRWLRYHCLQNLLIFTAHWVLFESIALNCIMANSACDLRWDHIRLRCSSSDTLPLGSGWNGLGTDKISFTLRDPSHVWP
jgi:hypothetical protein